jgi:hypothetical protein
MKSLPLLLLGSLAINVVASLAIAGCATHERVVVHDRPEVMREAPPPPVVHEQVIVRP